MNATIDSLRAPWFRRACAYFLDSLFLIVVTGAVFFAVEGHSYFEFHHAATPHGWLTRLLILCACAGIYYGAFMWKTNGQTLGKRALKVRVIRTDGLPVSVSRALWREVVVLIVVYNVLSHTGRPLSSIIWFLYVLDALWPLWDRKNRALHDFAAGTRVIRQSAIAN
jgi:uncharacterized RDD family membrane protein YckC